MKIKFMLVSLCLITLFQNNIVLAEDFTSEYEENSDFLSSDILIPIEELENTYILENDTYFFLVDENENKLIDMEFAYIDNKLSPGNTLVVCYPKGRFYQADFYSYMVLNKDLQIIVPLVSGYYSEPIFLESNEQIYIKVYERESAEYHYYDLKGNKLENEPTNPKILSPTYSEWARESIKEAIKIGIVPEDLQENYTNKITRKEFCQLAMQTYISKTGNNIDMNSISPFIDIDDSYVTSAYNLKIISGTSENEFSPDNYITRQEAAVMINNLANVLNISSNYSNAEKFVDESYFAAWAKNAIYSVSSINIMTGTGDGKFSPWYNYTREQAISTMLRLFNYE